MGPELCIQCGNCSFVCPHSVIRSRYYDGGGPRRRARDFPFGAAQRAGVPDTRYTLQVYVEDCTGCRLCVEACPVSAGGQPVHKAINLADARADGSPPSATTSRSSSSCQPTIGPRLTSPPCGGPSSSSRCSSSPVHAPAAARRHISSCCRSCSATGSRSPTPPAVRRSTVATCRPRRGLSTATDAGPAWSNSLFEDNAEFGLGLRLAADHHTDLARRRLMELREPVGSELVDDDT